MKPATSHPARSKFKAFFADRGAYVGGLVLGALFFGGCVYYAVKADGSYLNVLFCLFGGAAGWFVGILISPSTNVQQKQFGGYGKAISAFLSGFVVAKLDRVFEQAVTANADAAVLNLLLLRVLLFITTFTIGVLYTFAGRNFGFTSRADVLEPTKIDGIFVAQKDPNMGR